MKRRDLLIGLGVSPLAAPWLVRAARGEAKKAEEKRQQELASDLEERLYDKAVL